MKTHEPLLLKGERQNKMANPETISGNSVPKTKKPGGCFEGKTGKEK